MGVSLIVEHNLHCRRCDYRRLLCSSWKNDGRVGSRRGLPFYDYLRYSGPDHDGCL
jgi:hypothetical protein